VEEGRKVKEGNECEGRKVKGGKVEKGRKERKEGMKETYRMKEGRISNEGRKEGY
jgi:hypothetical protein